MTRLADRTVLTTTEAAGVSGLSRPHVSRLIDRGLMPGYRVPGTLHRRVPLEAFREWLLKHGMSTVEIDKKRGVK